jgi:hypothetical protein
MMMKKSQKGKELRQYALVQYEAYPGEKQGAIKKGAHLIFLGEIPNMPGHCVVSDVKTGKILVGFHTDRFHEIPDDQT